MDETTISNAEIGEIDALALRYAPYGLQQLRKDTQTLRGGLSRTKSSEGRNALRRSFLDTYRPITQADLDRLTELRDKAHGARAAELPPDVSQALDEARRLHIIDESEYARQRRAAERKGAMRAFEVANGLILALSGAQRHSVCFESTATDAERSEVAEDFEAFQRFEDAKDGYKRRYERADLAGKVALHERFPELHDAVFG